jgi:hypothetical protein
MSTYEPDERVQAFIAALTADGRRCYGATPGQVTHAHLVKALDAGWTPQHIADVCSKNLPTVANDAYRLIQNRIQWFAENKPRHEQRPPAGAVPWCGKCDDPNWRYVVDQVDEKRLWDEPQFRPCPRCHPSSQAAAAS